MQPQQQEYITELRVTDVLLGRGSGPNDHEGNIRFRQRVAARKAEYMATNHRQTKANIAQEIVDSVYIENGRFLRRLEQDELDKYGIPDGVDAWFQATDDVIMEKAKQALRQNTSKAASSSKPSAGGKLSPSPADRMRGAVVGAANAAMSAVSPIRGIGQPPIQIHTVPPPSSSASAPYPAVSAAAAKTSFDDDDFEPIPLNHPRLRQVAPGGTGVVVSPAQRQQQQAQHLPQVVPSATGAGGPSAALGTAGGDRSLMGPPQPNPVQWTSSLGGGSSDNETTPAGPNNRAPAAAAAAVPIQLTHQQKLLYAQQLLQQQQQLQQLYRGQQQQGQQQGQQLRRGDGEEEEEGEEESILSHLPQSLVQKYNQQNAAAIAASGNSDAATAGGSAAVGGAGADSRNQLSAPNLPDQEEIRNRRGSMTMGELENYHARRKDVVNRTPSDEDMAGLLDSYSRMSVTEQRKMMASTETMGTIEPIGELDSMVENMVDMSMMMSMDGGSSFFSFAKGLPEVSGGTASSSGTPSNNQQQQAGQPTAGVSHPNRNYENSTAQGGGAPTGSGAGRPMSRETSGNKKEVGPDGVPSSAPAAQPSAQTKQAPLLRQPINSSLSESADLSLGYSGLGMTSSSIMREAFGSVGDFDLSGDLHGSSSIAAGGEGGGGGLLGPYPQQQHQQPQYGSPQKPPVNQTRDDSSNNDNNQQQK